MTFTRPTEPTRTCVGCRERRPARHMARCVDRAGGRVSITSDGRGAWVCSIECFDRATSSAGFARAWRRSVDRDQMVSLREPVMQVLTMNATTVKDCD